jgi:hypothetical protein
MTPNEFILKHRPLLHAQVDAPWCGAYSVCNLASFLQMRDTGQAERFSVPYLQKLAGGSDDGTQLWRYLKVWKEQGLLPERDYSFILEKSRLPEIETRRLMNNYRIETYCRASLKRVTIRGYIMERGPMLALFNLPSGVAHAVLLMGWTPSYWTVLDPNRTGERPDNCVAYGPDYKLREAYAVADILGSVDYYKPTWTERMTARWPEWLRRAFT